MNWQHLFWLFAYGAMIYFGSKGFAEHFVRAWGITS